MRTPEYQAWADLKQRCSNPNNTYYHRYGKRGITYCARWEVFANFYEDMGDRPEGMSIDRIDNGGDYTPENCRWTDNYTQMRNTANNCNITYRGKTQCIPAWAEELNIPRSTLRWRMDNGWSADKTLNTPSGALKSGKPVRKFAHNGFTLTAAEWGHKLGMSRKTITRRFKAGWPAAKALVPAAALSLMLLPISGFSQSDWSEGNFSGRMGWIADDDQDASYYAGYAEGRDDYRYEEMQRDLDEYRREEERRTEEMLDELRRRD